MFVVNAANPLMNEAYHLHWVQTNSATLVVVLSDDGDGRAHVTHRRTLRSIGTL